MKKIIIFVYISLILVITILPIFSFADYSIIEHTTSHLGAQGSNNGWIMNVMFLVLGLTAIYISIITEVRFHQVVGILFGISLIGAAFFRHAPVNEMFEGNLLEDQLHSVFATLTGISFVCLAFGHGFMHKEKQRLIAFIVGVFATLISLGMMIFPDVMGILQRVMFMIAFYWLFFYMKVDQSYQINIK